MRARASSTMFLLHRLLILLMCLAPAVPFAEGPRLPDRANAPSQPRCSLQLVLSQAMEAIFVGGWLYGAQWSNVTTRQQPGKIILWDEGPANAARSVPVGPAPTSERTGSS